MAWGDWNDDGHLDLAVGNYGEPNHVYGNTGEITGTILPTTPTWFSTEADHTTSVAWGDWNGDGHLDLAVGNYGEPNHVYENTGEITGTILPTTPTWFSTEADHTTSVAWGDWNGDGNLDLAVGNYGELNQVYENTGEITGTILPATSTWFSLQADDTRMVAWGDWDNDGDLDLGVTNGCLHAGCDSQPTRVYENEGGNLEPLPANLPEGWYTNSAAWGDWDNDGDLDLALGNGCVGDPYCPGPQPNHVYKNEGGNLSLAWSSDEELLDVTKSVAWGDWDGDGDLDLAVGNGCPMVAGSCVPKPNRVYRNDTDGDENYPDALRLVLAWSSPVTETGTTSLITDTGDTHSVAWGDWDGDGDLDLAVGNSCKYAGSTQSCQSNQVYRNDTDGDENYPDAQRLMLAWNSPITTDTTRSVAWADWDGDGDLDLAIANRGVYTAGTVVWARNRVYENLGGDLSLAWSSEPVNYVEPEVRWGDWDGDGDQDLAVVSHGQPLRVYENLGAMLTVTATWAAHGSDVTYGVAWGDWDGDGDLELATAGLGWSPNRVYENAGGNLAPAWYSTDGGATTVSVAWGDRDGDGDLDLAAGNIGYSGVFDNHSQDILMAGADSPTWARISQPGGTAASFFASGKILNGPALPITYTLFDAEGDPARLVRAHYSLDGGSHWQPAVAYTGTITENLAASPVSTGAIPPTYTHTYTWDVYGSGIFGASDSVVFRLDVYQGFDGPGPYQYPSRSARTLPFRVRGSQVRVVDEDGGPMPGAIVYHRANNLTGLFEPYQDDKGRPFRTNPAGYLLGYGEIALGDQLVAMVPISHTESYTLYYTTAATSPTGLDAHAVTALGVQTLIVSADHPLYLFNLDLSLEWDARNDGTFLEDLELAIQRTSALFYDVSDGQAAIGTVRVYQDRENWPGADVVMYAQNGIRPRASMGGVAADLTDDKACNGDTIKNAYGPGQVRMGPNWDPFGQSLAELDTEWQRALAHELAHYLLYLPDNYLGVGENGAPESVDCKGSFMTNTYDDAYSELLPRNLWDEPDRGCEHTIAMSTTGRADWETVGRFYSAVYSPTTTFDGPSHLPLDITHVVQVPLSDTSQALPALVFDVRDEEYALLQVPGAQGFLFKTRGTPDDLSDDVVISLGQTVADGDRIKVRGAEPGDRLCILGPYDPTLPGTRAGCIESLQNTDRAVRVSPAAGWRPNVVVTAVTSRTLAVTATLAVAETGLNLQVLPTYGELTATEPISAPWKLMAAVGPTPTLTFTASITLAEPCFELMVRVWVPDSHPPREVLSPLYVSPPWGPDSPGVGGLNVPRAWGANKRQLGAPVASGDGGVTIWNVTDILADTGTMSLQAVHNLPGLDPWLAPVGPGYRFAAGDEPLPRAIAFNYLERNAPAGFEEALYVYYSPDNGATWNRLPTTLDTAHNQAAAVMPDSVETGYGQGLYVLACTIDLPGFRPGWNLFGYPLLGTRPIVQALASIGGTYTTVYDWQGAKLECYDCWHVYDATWNPRYNTLDALAFGETYWIMVTEGITLSLRPTVDTAMAPQGSLLVPPATFYGPVAAGAGFTPAVSMVVTATVGDKVCGLGETLALDGQVVYRVSVLADEPGYADGCGRPGRTVRFAIGGQRMACAGRWDNQAVQERALGITCGTYLPVVTRSH